MKYIESTDRKELIEEARSMSRAELIDFYRTYYSQDVDELETFSTSELRQVFVDGQLI